MRIAGVGCGSLHRSTSCFQSYQITGAENSGAKSQYHSMCHLLNKPTKGGEASGCRGWGGVEAAATDMFHPPPLLLLLASVRTQNKSKKQFSEKKNTKITILQASMHSFRI